MVTYYIYNSLDITVQIALSATLIYELMQGLLFGYAVVILVGILKLVKSYLKA